MRERERERDEGGRRKGSKRITKEEKKRKKARDQIVGWKGYFHCLITAYNPFTLLPHFSFQRLFLKKLSDPLGMHV